MYNCKRYYLTMDNKFIPVKFQAVIYANNQEITPEPNLIKGLYNEFEKYQVIPAPFNEMNIQTGAIIQNRLKFYKLDNSFSISFNLDKIDIQANVLIGNNINTLEIFTEQVNDILHIVNNFFAKKAYRIAIVVNYKVDSALRIDDNKIFEKTYYKIDTFPDIKPTEWLNRANYRFNREINKKSEMTNNIYTFSHGSGQLINGNIMVRSNDINLQLDINTIPELKTVRFSIEDFKSFYDQTPTWISDFMNSLNQKLVTANG